MDNLVNRIRAYCISWSVFSKWSLVFEVTYFQFIVYVHTSRMYIYMCFHENPFVVVSLGGHKSKVVVLHVLM